LRLLRGVFHQNAKGVDFRRNGRELLKSLDLLSIRPIWEGTVDAITDIFNTMHVTAVVNGKVEATAPWGLAHRAEDQAKHAGHSKTRVSPFHLAHFAMVSRGNCWLSVQDISDPIPLTGGDCFLVAPGVSYALRDHPRTLTKSFCAVAPTDGSNVFQHGGGGVPTTIITGLLSFEALSLKPITQLLPKLILIKADQAQNFALHTTLQMLASEMAEHSPGSEVVANRLAEVLFIQTLRAHISSATSKQAWLHAIFDPQIGAALKSIHENVNGAWTVESLAVAANMSRSAFAARFKELLGQTPLEYVTEWRMQKAAQLLKQKDKKLVEVAQSVGYESDAAFSKAFKRIVGFTPGEYRHNGSSSNLLEQTRSSN
jgi:AraC-like DNA-binding protein